VTAVVRRGRRTRSDRGSVLLLVPAGILIVVALGAMAVNAAVIFQGERRAANIANSVANDLATLALDSAHFRDAGAYRLSPDLGAAAHSVRAVALANADGSFVDGSLSISVVAVTPEQIQVTVSGSVEPLWNAPGLGGLVHVEAVAFASAAPAG
jgi:Tfp pilus assembly protein PilX